MQYGIDMPMVIPAMMIKKPRTYPKTIPVNHIGGPEGRNTTGKSAREAIITSANTGRAKDLASHRIIGMITYNTRSRNLI
jgi:hypothetical protein